MKVRVASLESPPIDVDQLVDYPFSYTMFFLYFQMWYGMINTLLHNAIPIIYEMLFIFLIITRSPCTTDPQWHLSFYDPSLRSQPTDVYYFFFL